jgi:hypothetical protein
LEGKCAGGSGTRSTRLAGEPNRILTRTIPLTLTPTQRAVSKATTPPALLRSSTSAAPEPSAPCPGGTHVIGQRVQVGLREAGQIVTIEVDETILRVYDHHDHLIKHVPRTSRKEVTRHKAYGHTTNRKTG